MNHSKLAIFGVAAALALFAMQPGAASAQATTAEDSPADATSIAEVIVTAQKRQENIQNVGMSIEAVSGDKLIKLGVTDTQSLQKLVPGFLFTPTYFGTAVYTIRGVGFQDTSLGSSPTVSVYVDEAPLPFSALTPGATLDLQRVEVLEGPQGTLFGNNATGGAINYIANKPTDTFQAGGDISYGRFSDTKFDAYVSGPLTDTLDGRIAIQTHTSGAWQKGYGPQEGQSIGGADFLNGRVSLLWKPTDKFKALLTVNGWQDKSFTQMGQLYGIAEQRGPLDPAIFGYPLAPHNNQAAGWNQCVNTSPFNPIAGQAAGAQWLTPVGAASTNRASLPNGGLESEGPGSVVWAGGQPTHCVPPRNDNTYYSGTLRMDYDIGNDLVLTSLTEHQKFNRTSGVDGSGMPIQDYQSYQRGTINSTFQELRIAGQWAGKGSWLFGANYEYDTTSDTFLQSYNADPATPSLLAYNSLYYNELLGGSPNSPVFSSHDQAVGSALGFALGPTRPVDLQKTTTYAVYANGEYPILEKLTLQSGVRFTQENKYGAVCGNDGGDGSWAALAYQIQRAFIRAAGLSPDLAKLAPPGTCASVGYPQNNYNPPVGLIASNLNQNNVSWRGGLNYKLTPNNLLYFNLSKGYKGGSYPTVALSTSAQAHPVVQESLLAYEGGFKSTLFDRQLQINGAGFYYDYTGKQILGALPDPLVGSLPALVNVPKSHVVGFELSGSYVPKWLNGLTITPAVSYQHTGIDRSSKNVCTAPIVATLAAEGQTCIPGDFYNYDPYSQLADFTHEKFPSVPEWQASVDGEYDWKLRDDMTVFIGANAQYTSATNSSFVNRTPLQPVGGYNVNGLPVTACLNAACTLLDSSAYNHPNDPNYVQAYTLVDLRAGIQRGDWRFQLWGRNVTNTYYWTSAPHLNDVLLRYTGMPATYGVTLSWQH
jgi:iron complex outermembrane recepter protein